MDTQKAVLTLEDLTELSKLTEPAVVDSLFKSYSPAKQTLAKLVLPLIGDFATLFFIIDRFELVETDKGEHHLNIYYQDSQFKEHMQSIVLND